LDYATKELVQWKVHQTTALITYHPSTRRAEGCAMKDEVEVNSTIEVN
jgi:hypothetical protein